MSLTNKRKSVVPDVASAVPEGVFIGRPVGINGTNDERDVRVVERLLGDAGFLDPVRATDPTGRMDSGLSTAIREFQKKTRLKTDGFLEPAGPTIRALNTLGTLPMRQKLLGRRLASGVEPEVVSANARLVSALQNSTDLGPLPTYLAEAANSGDAGQAEVVDLFRQVRAAAPDVSPRLHKALQPILDESLHRSLYAEAATPLASEEDPPQKPDDPSEPEKPDDPNQPDAPEEPDEPDDPGRPEEPDGPDEPDDPDDDDDEGKAKRCEELARKYREALAYFEAARKSWRKANEKYEELLAEYKEAQRQLDQAIVRFIGDWATNFGVAKAFAKIAGALTRWDSLKSIPLPSEVVRAWERVRDVEAAIERQRVLRDEFEAEMNEYRDQMNRLRAAMQALGCPQASG